MIKSLEKLYTWYWKNYRCRLEPWTFEWRRYAKKWFWVILIKAAVFSAALLWLLLFPLSDAPVWAKVVIIVVLVLMLTFYGWLLLHLGKFATKIRRFLLKG